MLVLTVGVVLALCGVSKATVCREDSDCGAGECCYIEPEFLVVSRRQALLPAITPTKSDTGVCEKYKMPDEPCSPLEVMNNHCGCTTGYACQFVPDPTAALTKRRIFMPGPGAYQCSPKQ